MDSKAIEKTFTEQLVKYSVELNVPFRDIQVLIYKNKEANMIEFNLYNKAEFVKKLSLQRDILNMKLDFMNKTFIVYKYLEIIMAGFATELQCEDYQVSVQFVSRSNDDATACMALQKDFQFVRWVDLKEFEF